MSGVQSEVVVCSVKEKVGCEGYCDRSEETIAQCEAYYWDWMREKSWNENVGIREDRRNSSDVVSNESEKEASSEAQGEDRDD